MKKGMVKLLACGLGSLFFLFALASSLPALTIDDSTLGANTYYGGTIYGSYNDIIGVGTFDVDGMVVTQSGSIVSIVLSGPYFGTSYASGVSPYGNPGDLYISTGGWDVNNPADHARNDTFDSDEGWNYVISYTYKTIYALKYDNIKFSGSESHWSGYRSGQAWRDGYGASVYAASVNLDTSAKTLTFSFDGTNLGSNAYAWGYHWTMACGNDVVEGGTPVPEPATLLLLGLGLVGLAVTRKK